MRRTIKMMRYLRMLILGMVLSGLIVASGFAETSYSADKTVEYAEEIHFDAVVVDTHNDTMMKVVDPTTWLPSVNIGEGQTTFHIDIPKMQEGGLDVPFFAAYQSDYGSHSRNVSRTLALLNALYWTASKNPDSMGIATSLKEIHDLTKKGKIAAVSTIEGGYSLRPSEGIELLHQYYDLGVRAVALTHSVSNWIGEGVNRKYWDGTPSDGGLTEFGGEVVREMNRLGMIIDVSHLAESTFWDVIEVSEAPIIASHSGVYSLRAVPRNLTDAQIMALARNGGIVQIVFSQGFLVNPGVPATVGSIVDHIDYVVNLVGVDYVGIGSDFDGTTVPADLRDASGLPKITEELVRRGYSKPEIDKILGGNTLRVLREVEHLAEKSPTIVGQAPSIIPTLSMGVVISEQTPLLTAHVDRGTGSPIEESSFRIILDGNVYIPDYDKTTGILSLQVTDPLTVGLDGFHVVTFEAANIAGKVSRETGIFYVQ